MNATYNLPVFICIENSKQHYMHATRYISREVCMICKNEACKQNNLDSLRNIFMSNVFYTGALKPNF